MTLNKLMVIVFLLLTLPFISTCTAEDIRPGSYVVTVNAGAFDRADAIVSFLLPVQIDDGIYLMKDDSNEPVYLQVKDNKGRFILRDLGSGASKAYTFNAEPYSGESPAAYITKEIDSISIKFKSGGNSVLGYFYKENEAAGEINPRFKRAGYIHPVYTPGGVRVTQHFNPRRPGHYGIWSAWSRTEFQGRQIGFWGGGQDTGVVADTLEQIWEGPVYGGFRAKHRFMDFSAPEPITVLNEQWDVIVYQAQQKGNYHVFDINIIQTSNNGIPVEIFKYNYGGINIRGHEDWNGEGNMDFISSEGYDRNEVVGKRIRWSHMSGYIEGKLAGLGLLGHPGNGSNPDGPYGAFINQNFEPFHSYGPAPVENTSIKPGSPWMGHYRFIAHDGEMNPEELERLWNDYANPPTVFVTKEQ